MQSYTNIELVLINDCSTDDTAAIVEHYAGLDKRVRVIHNETNLKLPASLNKGFSVANGEYFTWTSDDNFLGKDALRVLLDNMQAKGADIIYSSYNLVNKSGGRLEIVSGIPEEIIFKCVVGACFLYKRSVHEQLGGYDAAKYGLEDFDFWLKAFTKFKVRFIDHPDLYFYRKHRNSLTWNIHSDVDRYRDFRKAHVESFEKFFNEGLGANLSDEEIHLHLEIYFEDIVRHKDWDFDITERVLKYTRYLNKLLHINWELIGLNSASVQKVIEEKRDRIIALTLNDLIFANKLLQKENPKLARNLNGPISWYYKEYEVLPLWFKRLGHILKILQNNRSWRSIFTTHRNL